MLLRKIILTIIIMRAEKHLFRCLGESFIRDNFTHLLVMLATSLSLIITVTTVPITNIRSSIHSDLAPVLNTKDKYRSRMLTLKFSIIISLISITMGFGFGFGLISTYINTKMSVCLCVHFFLGHFETD